MKRSFKRYLYSVTAFLILASCSTASVRLDSKPVIIEKVPFYPQEDYQCGPASLAGVLNYWGVGVNPEDPARAVYSTSARGTLNLDLVLYANKKGVRAIQYSGGWDDLKARIDDGYPLVVLVDLGFSLYEVNHFMVVIGYSDNGVIVNSGRAERMVMDKEKFLSAWKRAKFWTLWIKPGEVKSLGR